MGDIRVLHSVGRLLANKYQTGLKISIGQLMLIFPDHDQAFNFAKLLFFPFNVWKSLGKILHIFSCCENAKNYVISLHKRKYFYLFCLFHVLKSPSKVCKFYTFLAAVKMQKIITFNYTNEKKNFFFLPFPCFKVSFKGLKI